MAFLGEVDPARLDELAADGGYVEWAERERAGLRDYLSEPRWFQSLGTDAPRTVAYFSPEFGITAALPQYSGGLGILAGDHLKAASDLGRAAASASASSTRPATSPSRSRPTAGSRSATPCSTPTACRSRCCAAPTARPCRSRSRCPTTQSLHARVWKAAVGRITLLLLDTDIPANTDELRSVTDRLYGGGGEHRLLQELLLGIGGARAVRAFTELSGGPAPDVFHMNEGHAGFLGLERIATHIAEGLSFAEALQLVRAGTVFTTHTPVPAGIDRFDRALVERYLTSSLLPGVDPADALALGVEPGADPATSAFNMAVMGLRLAQRANGVSKLHGQVSRRMFGDLWPGFDPEDVPITSITNGVHAPTWTDPALLGLAESTLGTDDTEHADWAQRRPLRRRVLGRQATHAAAARRGRASPARRGVERAARRALPAPPWVSRVLDPDTLTVGFARRVPTYKRLTLMLSDPERLKAILTNPERPVQFVIAGKSHPADDEGKRLIQQLVQFAQQPELRERIVFLPDYDMGMAELLYPGCDVWLNNPLRPLEACGTSGMKAAMNGALNLSILDGWWAEYAGDDYGWVIPSADAAGDAGERDALEAAALYELLEHRVATRYYERDARRRAARVGAPRAQHARDARARARRRPHGEAVRRGALPPGRRAGGPRGGRRRPRRARARGVRGARARRRGPRCRSCTWSRAGSSRPHVGDELRLRAYVELDGLAPDDVAVEVVYGRSRTDESDRGRAPHAARTRCRRRPRMPRRARMAEAVHRHGRARPGGRVRVHGARRAAASAARVARRARARRRRRRCTGAATRLDRGRDYAREASRSRAIGAYRPPVTAMRSSGASSRSRPRRPPDTKIVSARIGGLVEHGRQRASSARSG